MNTPTPIAALPDATITQQRLADIRLLVLDFDGVLTDNRVFVFEDGREAVACSRGDGMGVGLATDAGIEVVVLSKETNPVVSARCRKLKIACDQSCDDKAPALARMIADRGLTADQVAFMGNDINDVPPMQAAGLAFAPADAHRSAMAVTDVVTALPGGHGAVREVCDLLVAMRLGLAGG